MRYVYIARHGQSTWNAEGRWTGAADVPLSEMGEEQARAAVEVMRGFGFDAVYSSALVRARRTAEMIADGLGIPFGGMIPEFNERDVGVISGLTPEEIDAQYPGLLDTWRHGGIPVEPPGGETWRAFVERVMAGFSRVAGERSLLIAHAGVMRAVAESLGEPLRKNGNLEGRWVSVSSDHAVGADDPPDFGNGTRSGLKEVTAGSDQNRFQFRQPVDLTTIRINGDRVSLCSIHEKYGQEIFEEFTEEITRYMNPSPPKNINEAFGFISRSREGMREGRDLVCAIVRRDTEEFLGCCGFHWGGAPSTPELGVWLKKGAHGNGYGREAIALLVSWAVQHIDFDYLTYPVDRANRPSRKIPEALGGTIFKEGKARRMNGGFLDEVVYRIPRKLIEKGC